MYIVYVGFIEALHASEPYGRALAGYFGRTQKGVGMSACPEGGRGKDLRVVIYKN